MTISKKNNNEDTCFKHAITAAMNHEKMEEIHNAYQRLDPTQISINENK